MEGGSNRHRGFTLVELLVVIAIIGVLIALLMPAVQSAREAARRVQCANNLKQLALGMLNYASSMERLPPGAVIWKGDPERTASATPRWYDDHGWYTQIGPYIEQQAWYNQINFSTSFSDAVNDAPRRNKMATFSCPSDGLKQNEWQSPNWARVRFNYVVNWGNTNYGQLDKAGVVFAGAPFKYRCSSNFARITDGTSNTLCMSEVLTVLENGTGWGGPLSDGSTSLGGQTFNAWLTPNSASPDEVNRLVIEPGFYTGNGIPVPILLGSSDDDALSQSFAARSHHPGGVNASYCDGSIRFCSESIDLATWRAQATSRGGEVVDGSKL